MTITRARFFFSIYELWCINFSLTVNVCYMCFLGSQKLYLFWLNNIYEWIIYILYTYNIYYIFFIQSSTDGHLGCFYVFAIIHDAGMNIRLQISLWDSDLFPSETYLELGLLDQTVVVFLIFSPSDISQLWSRSE